jgi:hypothetical protein
MAELESIFVTPSEKGRWLVIFNVGAKIPVFVEDIQQILQFIDTGVIIQIGEENEGNLKLRIGAQNDQKIWTKWAKWKKQGLVVIIKQGGIR